MTNNATADPNIHAYFGAVTALSALWNSASAAAQAAFDAQLATNPAMYQHIERCVHIAQAATWLFVPASCADIHDALISSMRATIELYTGVMAGDTNQAALAREAAEHAAILSAALTLLRDRLDT